jgi:hypothetical protein
MADLGIKAGDAASKYRTVAGQLLDAYKELLSIDTEYIAIDVLGELPADYFADITNAEFGSGVSAAQTIMAAIVTNQTNLER